MRIPWLGAVLIGLTSAVLTLAQLPTASNWIAVGSSGVLPQQMEFATPTGRIGVLFADGPVEMKGHPFFTALGSNGRACVTCHQPAFGMSFSAEGARELWRQTSGKDPLFAAVDGSNCPDLPQDQEKSHSLLLKRGLIRVFLPVPKNAEFTIEVVSDPTGCESPAVRYQAFRRLTNGSARSRTSASKSSIAGATSTAAPRIDHWPGRTSPPILRR